MKKKLSRKHHYIPQFHLREFYSEKSFTVYDKEIKKFKLRPQTSSMVMFENDRNTCFINDIKSDLIETSYSKLETPISELFKIALSDDFLDVLGVLGETVVNAVMFSGKAFR